MPSRPPFLRSLPRLLPALLLLLLCGCQDPPAPPAVVLTINGQSLTLETFNREFEDSLRTQGMVTPERRLQLLRQFMARLVDRTLLEQEAKALGIAVAPVELAAAMDEVQGQYPDERRFEEVLAAEGTDPERWRRSLEQRLLIRKVTEAVAKDTAVPTDAEVAQHYEAHRAEFHRPEQLRARQLVVATETEGRAALERLRAGEAFEQVAREVSLSPDAEQGGDLGFFGRGEMPPEFDEVVFSLATGRRSDLVNTPYGWHIFLVEERRPAVNQTLDDVREAIRAALARQRAEAAYQAWLQGVRADARIDINWTLLARPPE